MLTHKSELLFFYIFFHRTFIKRAHVLERQEQVLIYNLGLVKTPAGWGKGGEAVKEKAFC